MSNSVKPSTKKQEILALRISVRIFFKKTAPALTSATPPDIYPHTKRKSHDLHYFLVPAFSLLCSTASVLFSAAVWMAWQGGLGWVKMARVDPENPYSKKWRKLKIQKRVSIEPN